MPKPLSISSGIIWTAKGRYDVLKVSHQINGYFLKDTVIEDKVKKTTTLFKKGQLVPTFGNLQADGSDGCGNWCHDRKLR